MFFTCKTVWSRWMRRAAIWKESPTRRIGMPEDIAAAAAFLASEEAGWFTGQVMSPNGGGHMG